MRKISIILIALLSVLLAFVACNNSIDDAFQPTDPRYMPLTLEFLADGTLSITAYEGYGDSDVYYSRNGKERIKLVDPINVYTGDKICLYRDWGSRSILHPHISIGCSSYCYVYGNVMSLIDSENFATATEVYDSAFYELFAGNTHITNHESLDLVLPATTLAISCYESMFQGCTGLTRAPELPAKTLVDYCYYGMFSGCSNLNSITCLATNIIATDCTENWIYEVPTGGTFTRAPGNDVGYAWSYKTDSPAFAYAGIPSGWTVIPELP